MKISKRLKEKKSNKVKLRLLVILSFFLIIGITYILFFTSTFTVKEIKVTFDDNSKLLYTNEIKSYLNAFKGSNILLLKLNNDEIKKKFPVIQNINIVRIPLNKIEFVVKEYDPSILFQTKSKTYVYNENGVLIDTLVNNTNKYNKLPIVTVDEKSISGLPVSDIYKYISKIKVDKSDIVVSYNFTMPYELTGLYSDGHRIIITLNKSIDEQLNQAKQVKDSIGITKCFIMDVRFENVYCTPK